MVIKYKILFLYSLKKIVKTVKNRCSKMIRKKISQEKEEEGEESYVVTGITWYLRMVRHPVTTVQSASSTHSLKPIRHLMLC